MTDRDGSAFTQKRDIANANLGELIAMLSEKDGLHVRQAARERLVQMNGKAVPELIALLNSPNSHARWEAAKALGEIGDPRAGKALVAALEDRDFGVRWLAANGLIALDVDGARALLEALLEKPDAAWLREGAHHVFSSLAATYAALVPVVKAMEGPEPEVTIPQAARDALDVLER